MEEKRLNATAEQLLIVAIIERGVLDAMGSDGAIGRKNSPQLDRAKAKLWLFNWDESNEEHEPWSFPWCCEQIGANPERARRQIKNILGANHSGHCTIRSQEGRAAFLSSQWLEEAFITPPRKSKKSA